MDPLPKVTAGDEPQPYEKNKSEGLVPLSNNLTGASTLLSGDVFQCPEGLVPLSNHCSRARSMSQQWKWRFNAPKGWYPFLT